MSDANGEIIRRQFDTNHHTPAIAVVETVAELEGTDSSELSSIYNCIDHMVDHLFSEPPSPGAQVQVRFTYEGYRVTINQDGNAEFRRIE